MGAVAGSPGSGPGRRLVEPTPIVAGPADFDRLEDRYDGRSGQIHEGFFGRKCRCEGILRKNPNQLGAFRHVGSSSWRVEAKR